MYERYLSLSRWLGKIKALHMTLHLTIQKKNKTS